MRIDHSRSNFENDSHFNDIVHLVSLFCRVPYSAISIAAENGLVYTNTKGLEKCSLSRLSQFCELTIQQNEVFIVNDTSLDKRFMNTSAVKEPPLVRFYAGVPITSRDGHNLGTLCVLDTQPNQLSSEQKHALKILSQQISSHFELLEKLKSEKELKELLAKKGQALASFFKTSPIMMGIVEIKDNQIIHISDNQSTLDFMQINKPLENPTNAKMMGIKEENISHWLRYYKEAQLNKNPVYFNYPHQTNNGTRILSAVVNLLSDEDTQTPRFSYVAMDRTNEVEKQSQLHFEKTRLDLISENIGDVIWMWNPHSNQMEYVNSAFEDLWEIKISDFKNDSSLFYRYMHPDDIAHVKAQFQLAKVSPMEVEYRIVTESGKIKYVLDKSFPIKDQSGQVTTVIGIASDQSERIRLQKETEVQRAKMIHSSRLTSLGEMAGNIAHEINNPLAVIKTSAQLLELELKNLGSVVSPRTFDTLKRIDNTVNRISKIVKGLRSFSRTGEQDPFVEIKINSLVQEAIEMCQTRFLNHGVKLASYVTHNDFTILGRPVELVQVIVNLLNNAFDAVSDAPIKAVEICINEDHNFVSVEVSDTGPGIPPEAQARIMDPFFTTKPLGQGTGLGLSISKGITEAHNGELTFKRELNRTIFVLRLPQVVTEKKTA